MSKIDKNTIPENFTVGLAIFDFFPVLFFALCAVLLSFYLPGPCFIVGALLCFFAGLAKVIWKIIVATKKKNIWFLFIQMRIIMPIGFLLMTIGIILNASKILIANIVKNITSMPSVIFFILWFVGMTAMTICAFKLDSSNLKHNLIEQSINTIAQCCLLVGLIFIYLNNGSYMPNETALTAMEDVPCLYDVEIKDDNNIYFTPDTQMYPDGPEAAFIFYPGAKVNYESYAPLMSMLASDNILCIVVKMPFDLAIFSRNAADGIKNQFPEIKHWYIGGHSLGGAMAADYIAMHVDQYDGLILLAAYSQPDLSSSGLSVLSIYGSNDQVLNMDNYNKFKQNLPSDAKEFVIAGGCHAFFGSYGFQKGDGTPSITDLDQASFTAKQISEFMKTN